MKKFILMLITLILVSTSATAKWKDRDSWKDQSSWENMDSGEYSSEKVRVTEHIKITKPFTTQVKVGEECYQDTVELEVPCSGKEDTNSIGVDTVVGATIGVIVGNQIGKGNGKDAAKVIGGLLGATIANSQRQTGVCSSYETIDICNPKYKYKTVNKVIGWNNCIYIDNQRYCKKTVKRIKWLRVKKTITVY